MTPGTEGEVRYERDEGVATILLDRPSKLNALNRQMREQLFEAFRRFADDEEARVAIVTGAGRAFCAGADLSEMSASGLKVPPKDFTPRLGRNVAVDKPVIAAVNGPAFAGGFLLVQMCDLAIAGESATFGITEARVGRGAPWATPLLSMMSRRVVLEMLITAEPISAGRAYEVGLVNRVVADECLIDSARELARSIARNAPLTVKASTEMVRLAVEMGPSLAEEVADRLFESVYLSEDAQEGPTAFREGREPQWTGR